MNTPASARLGPNDVESCPSPACRMWHLAHGKDCEPCGTDRPVPEQYPADARKEPA